MDDPKAYQLFHEVLSKTRVGRIKWAPTADESEYVAVLPGDFILGVLKFIDQNPHGHEIERLALALRSDDREILRVTDDVDGVSRIDLKELYESARRQAVRDDAKVDQLLSELAKL